MASVWLVFGEYDHDRDDHDFRRMGTRIIGPIFQEHAEALIERLQTSFTTGGFHVTSAATADD